MFNLFSFMFYIFFSIDYQNEKKNLLKLWLAIFAPLCKYLQL